MIHPFLVIEIPFYRFFDTLLKLERWLPAEFLLELARIDGITHIVPLSVCYISDQIQVSTLRTTEQSINGPDNHLDDIDILPLVKTTDVVSLGNLALMENHIDGTGMIHYIQPVAHVLTLTIYRQWLAMTDVVDEQRNQLLWELVWTIVVRAVGHDGRHTVCIVESTNEVVGASLGCRVWRVRIVLGSLQEELLAVSLVVLIAGSFGSERSRNALYF